MKKKLTKKKQQNNTETHTHIHKTHENTKSEIITYKQKNSRIKILINK